MAGAGVPVRGAPLPIPRMRDFEGGYRRPSSFLALERVGRNDAVAETEPRRRIPPLRAVRDGSAGMPRRIREREAAAFGVKLKHKAARRPAL